MKYLSYEGLAHLKLLIQNALNLKVDKEDGKGLSTNDYTTEEKTKLAGIEDGATKTIIDSSLSSTSTNPVENKAVNAALVTKVDKVNGKGLSTNDYTDTEKSKLAGIAEGANKTIIDSTLSSTSTNPVQNKIINGALGTKVDKVEGKGLSENDLTDELLTKINNTASKVEEIATVGGEPNVIEVIKRNGTILDINDKAVDITVPTKVSELTNDSKFTTLTEVGTQGYLTEETDPVFAASASAGITTSDINKWNNKSDFSGNYSDLQGLPTIPTNNNELTNGAGYQTAADVSALIGEAISGIQGITYSVVSSLPSTGEAGVIYLVSNSGSNPNIYDEYIYVNNKFEKIGTTDVDLSGYVQNDDITAITNSEIDAIWAS